MPEKEVPVVIRCIAVWSAVLASVKIATIVDRVIWSGKGIAWIVIDHTTVPIIWVVDVGDTVVVVIPIDVVLEAVAVDVGIDRVWSIVTVQCSVDGVKVSVIVQITVRVNVKCIDDSIVVIVDVVPICDSVAIPVIELGERRTSCCAARVRVCGVWICRCWAVPCCDISGCVQWECVEFILDLVIVKIVLKVACVATYGDIAQVVRCCGPAHVRVEPIVDSVVVLVEWSQAVVVEVLVVIDFTIGASIVIAVRSWNFEVHTVDACNCDGRSTVSTTDGDLSANIVAVSSPVDCDCSDCPARGSVCHDIDGECCTVLRGCCHVCCRHIAEAASKGSGIKRSWLAV